MFAFEVVPPIGGTSQEELEQVAQRFVSAMGREIHHTALLVEDIDVDEVHENGKKRPPRMSPDSYVERALRTAVSNIAPKTEFVMYRRMLRSSVDEHVRWVGNQSYKNIALMGMPSHASVDHGASVVDTARAIRTAYPEKNLIGMCIPSRGHFSRNGTPLDIIDRHRETRTIIEKENAGISDFVTQILMETTYLSSMLDSYTQHCAEAGKHPVPFFLSVVPVTRNWHYDLLHKLGVMLPHDVQKRMNERKRNGRLSQAISNNIAHQYVVDMLQQFFDNEDRRACTVPFGINVCCIDDDCLNASVDLLGMVRERFGPYLESRTGSLQSSSFSSP